MEIRIVTVGKIKEKYLCDGIADCSDAFLSSPVQQKQYLTYTLSCLIGTLERV